jgi:hypothetical protein
MQTNNQAKINEQIGRDGVVEGHWFNAGGQEYVEIGNGTILTPIGDGEFISADGTRYEYAGGKLGNLFKKVVQAPIKAAKKVNAVAKTIVKKQIAGTKKVLGKVGTAAKAGVQLMKVLNLAPIRAGVLLAARINLKGMAIRLYPALLTTEELKKEKLNLPNAEVAKKAFDRASDIYVKLGGKRDAFAKAIKNGAKRKVAKLKKKTSADGVNFYYVDVPTGLMPSGGFDGDSEDVNYFNVAGVDDALIAAALSAIVAIIAGITKTGAKKNPYDAPPAGFDQTGMEDDIPANDIANAENNLNGIANEIANGNVANPNELPNDDQVARNALSGKSVDENGNIVDSTFPQWAKISLIGLGVGIVVFIAYKLITHKK